MRMHTHGKCTPNIILGALTVFCVIVLYNYWTVSTLNHDLILKIHSLEQTIMDISKSNDALQAKLSKVEEIKEKVEGNLKKEQEVDHQAKEEISHKDSKIKALQNDLENSKQALQNCRDDLAASESKTLQKEKEITEMKDKVVSLEAQLVEKGNKVTRIEQELKDAQKRLSEKGVSSSTSKSVLNGKAGSPVQPPAVEVAQHDDQPVLMNDPAVPYPKGWMSAEGPVQDPIHVKVKTEGDLGIQRTRSMGPVIIFDPPNLPRKTARFSVMDRPKNEMKPVEIGKSDPLHKPLIGQQEERDTHGGEDLGQAEGVLPIPGQSQNGQHPKMDGPNLDAAEDDGERPLKDEFGLQDDQSPDGALSQKEVNAAIQAPEIKHHESVLLQHNQNQPFDNNL